MTLSITAHLADDSSRLELTGRLDNASAPLLASHCQEALTRDMRVLVIDMAGLNYISSSGIREILIATKAMKARQGRVALARMQPHVQKVFEILKALPDLSVFASLAEMDDYLSTFQQPTKNP